jgi:hypothetical protein
MPKVHSMTLAVRFFETDDGKFSARCGVDFPGLCLGPSEKLFRIENYFLNGKSLSPQGVKLGLRAFTPFLKRVGDIVFIGAYLAHPGKRVRTPPRHRHRRDLTAKVH